jgi:hypothetical protein
MRLALLACLIMISTSSVFGETQRTIEVTEPDVQAVIIAIKDEIYANAFQREYLDVGPENIPLYINPHWENGMIWIIYKLMPYGEVFRGAHLNKDQQLAVLQGDPHNGFPPTQGGSMKTVYLNDEDVIRMKMTWKKSLFSIDMKPKTEQVQEARKRQETRFNLKYR